MIDLCITGILESEAFKFTVGNETKTIDQFSKSIHFVLNPKQIYRVYFEQTRVEYISRRTEDTLNLFLLPIQGLFNILTFNVERNWETDISAFSISGYIELNLEVDTEISFEYLPGSYDVKQEYFCKPILLISKECPINKKTDKDYSNIQKKHNAYIRNVISVSIWFYVLFLFLMMQSLRYGYHIAFVIVLSIIVAITFLIMSFLVSSIKKKKRLIQILSKQKVIEDTK